jgi:uncharacterized iron-regulated membrane protein
MNRRLRWLLGKIHLWLGLAIALYFAFLGVTGSLLVFGREIDLVRESEVHRVIPNGEPVPLSRVLAGFRGRHPGEEVGYINYPRTPDGTYSVRQSTNSWNQRYTYLNPYTGDIVGERTRGGTFYGVLCYLHFYLAAGKAGWTANGYGALLVLTVMGSGVAIWWPTRKGQWKVRLGLRRDRGTRVFLHDLHNATGIWTLPFLAMFALSAVVFAFKEPSEAVVYALTGVRTTPKPVASKSGETLPIDQLVAIADKAVDGRVQRVNFPKKAGDPLVVRKEWENWNQTRDRVEVAVDPVTGKVLAVDDSRTWPLGRKLIQWAIPTHFGLIGGMPTRILWVVLGLAPVLLMWTGWRQYRMKVESIRNLETRRARVAGGKPDSSESCGVN